MIYPSTFKVSRRAPSLKEMNWLYEWISTQIANKDLISTPRILEFGSGITTYVISSAIPNFSRYVCVENFPLCVDQVQKHVNRVEFEKLSWHNIPKIEYDLVFVDSSSLAPPDLKSLKDKVFRDDAIHYVMPFVAPNCYFIVHDWCYKWAWLRPKRYFKERNYKLIASLTTKHGIGIYRKNVIGI